MRYLLALMYLCFAGCAPTNYPFILGSLPNRTDVMARDFIGALATHDQAKLEQLGRSTEAARSDLKDAPQLATPPRPEFLMDMIIGSGYSRQYAVRLATGGETEIRVRFTNSEKPYISSYQVLERVP